MSNPKFTKLHDSLYISRRFHSGEFAYWLVMQVIDWREAVGEQEHEEVGADYNVCLLIVSPEQAGNEKVASALNGCGLKEPTDAQKAAALAEYGVSVQVWNENGNNLRDLLAQGREEAAKVSMLFGFYMDRRVNAIGTTGWEAIKGDYDSAIARCPGTTGDIMRKMSGVQPVTSP